jgi:hypothetical protein
MAFDEGRDVDSGDLLLALVERDAITRAALAGVDVTPERLREAVRAARSAGN